MPQWSHASASARDLVTKLLEPNPRLRLSADEALQHPWIVLRGHSVTGSNHDLRAAQRLLKQQVAQKRLTSMWHALDIINHLESSGAPRCHSSSRDLC